jgi:hypothetical protein
MKMNLKTAIAVIGATAGIMTWIMFAYWLSHLPR